MLAGVGVNAAIALIVGADSAIAADLRPLHALHSDRIKQVLLDERKEVFSLGVLEQRDQVSESRIAVMEDGSRISFELRQRRILEMAQRRFERLFCGTGSPPIPEVMLRRCLTVMSALRESERGRDSKIQSALQTLVSSVNFLPPESACFQNRRESGRRPCWCKPCCWSKCCTSSRVRRRDTTRRPLDPCGSRAGPSRLQP